MGKRLILCEKPAQARTYGECYEHQKHKDYIEINPCNTFPEGAKIVWAIGHLAAIAPPEIQNEQWKEWKLDNLPMIPENFQYTVSPDKKSHFISVKKHLQEAEEIIIATDPGREGQNIATTILLLTGCKKKPLKRFWCSSMTPVAIRKAFDNLEDNKKYEPLYEESKARAYSDWLIGMNTSRVYSLLLGQRGIRNNGANGMSGVFSAGRIQSPLLFMIHLREEEITNFKPEKFWEVYGEFSSNGIKYKGKLQNDDKNRFKDQEIAKAIIHSLEGITAYIESYEVKKNASRPPKLHNLSSLQAKINKSHKISPKKVLELVQSLYEKGFCSYPRSEYQYLPKDEAKQLPLVLEKLVQLEPYSTLVHNKNKSSIDEDKYFTDDSKVGDHFAIIATDKIPNLSQLSKEEYVIYDEIVKSTIAPFYDDYIYNQTTLITKAADYHFKSTGKQILNNGWKEIWNSQEKSDQEDNQTLPIVIKGQTVALNDINLKDGITNPQKPYTEGQLITLMKNPSYKNFDTEEISQKEMSAYGSLGTEATRSGIIETLKTRGYIQVKKNIVEVTPKGKILVKVIDKTILSSPELTAMWEKSLEQIGKGKQSSKAFIEQSKALAKKLVEDAKVSSPSWELDAFIEQIQQENCVGKCPNCGKNIVDMKKFFGCTGYNDGCRFTLPKELLGKKISDANIKRLLDKGKTGLIKGLKGKTEFDAHLIIKDRKEGKLGFEFPVKAKK